MFKRTATLCFVSVIVIESSCFCGALVAQAAAPPQWYLDSFKPRIGIPVYSAPQRWRQQQINLMQQRRQRNLEKKRLMDLENAKRTAALKHEKALQEHLLRMETDEKYAADYRRALKEKKENQAAFERNFLAAAGFAALVYGAVKVFGLDGIPAPPPPGLSDAEMHDLKAARQRYLSGESPDFVPNF